MLSHLSKLTFLLVVLLFQQAFSLNVDSHFRRANLADVCDVWVTEQINEVNGSQLAAVLADAQWQSCHGFDLSRGYADESIWLKVKLHNTAPKAVSLVFDIYVSWLGHIKAFELDRGQLIKETTFGINYPFNQQAIATPNTLFGVYLNAKQSRTLYIQIHGDQSLLIGGFIDSERNSYKHQVWITLINGGLIFTILTLALYNFVLYLSLRDINYLFYCTYSLSMLFLLSVVYGFSYQLIWPQSVSWNYFSIAASSHLTALFIILFVRNFLETKASMPRLDRLLQVIFYAALFMLVLCFPESTRALAMSWSGPLAALGGPAVLFVGLSAWYEGNRAARYFTLAWSASLVTITILGLMVIGYLQFNFWLYYSFAFGVLAEVAIISLALADKYHNLRREKNAANQAALIAERELAALLKQTATKLEQEVRVRTADLRQAKQAAEHLARTDVLTGMSNRRAYFEQGNRVFNQAVLDGKKYGIVMLDIDKFKVINDTYGHAVGDKVIIEIANLLATLLPDDAIAGRIGGEEFGIILPNYALDTATDVAEAMRELVEETHVAIDNQQTISVTISAGVAEYLNKDRDIDESMARADIGLYQAKESGRNKVITYQADVD